MYFKLPTTLDEMILSESNRKQLEIISKMKGFYLIHSNSTGSGKSLAAKLVAESISSTTLFIDASCTQSAKQIDNLDRKLAFPDLNNNIPVVVIDEIDKLNSNKLQMISSAYNKFANKIECVVIMTANSTDKLPANLISRVNGIDFNHANNEEQVIEYIANIVEENSKNKELNKYFLSIVRKILSASNGDVRKLISYTEKFLITNEIDKNPLLTSGY